MFSSIILLVTHLFHSFPSNIVLVLTFPSMFLLEIQAYYHCHSLSLIYLIEGNGFL